MTNDNDNDNEMPKPGVMSRPEVGETLIELDKFEAPFQREIKLHAVEHESGMRMLRLNIREKRRFTVLDIDAKTARHWAKLMSDWADVAESQQDPKD